MSTLSVPGAKLFGPMYVHCEFMLEGVGAADQPIQDQQLIWLVAVSFES